MILKMYGNEYQEKASRTMNPDLTDDETLLHALHGMASEVGEIHGIFQKVYQGHALKNDHLMKETGDLLWFIAEFCTIMHWNLEDVMERNIEKLKKRFPEGFEADKSLNRAKGDI